jgi:hypothetical protein
MAANIRMWWRGSKQSMPLIRRDIKHFSTLPDASHSDMLSDANWKRGRLAKSDHVASCLLRRNYASAMPVRREVRIGRNQRRLKLLFATVALWWIAGRLLMSL